MFPFDMLSGVVCGVAARGVDVWHKLCVDVLYKLVLVVALPLWTLLLLRGKIYGPEGHNREEGEGYRKRKPSAVATVASSACCDGGGSGFPSFNAMTLEESNAECKSEEEEDDDNSPPPTPQPPPPFTDNTTNNNTTTPTNTNTPPAPYSKAVIHPCVDPPLCASCQSLDLSFFDPMCSGCRAILDRPTTSVPQIFAILRQWTPQTQHSLRLLVDEILKRGASINDRDGLTDMTLLHYASKAGAAGIGDPQLAAQVAADLVEKGADVNIRSRWTNMTALHYTAYFNVPSVMKVLLKATRAMDIESTCTEFENGTSLHIAAFNLAHDAVKLLIQNGADANRRDSLGRTPAECVPDPVGFDKDSDIGRLAQRIRKTLLDAASTPSPTKPPPNYDLVQSKVMLQAMGLQLGDKVVVNGSKTGSLRYCGPTEFASGVWAGIELDEAAGKNDGSVGGISYFTCPSNHGVFAPISKVGKPGVVAVPRSASPSSHSQVSSRLSLSSPVALAPTKGQVDVSHVTARVDTGLSKSRPSSVASESDEMEIGDRVIVAGQRKGTVRYVGETRFAPGVWFGVELDQAAGKNNGSVAGVHYFSCRPKHGVFAPLSRIQKLGDHHFSSNESLDTISWGAMSERVDRKALALRKTPTKSPKTSAVSTARSPISHQSSSAQWTLEVGMSVFCNGELGTVRYIGTTDFAEGTWVGVEMRTAKGKNDGSVLGRRYFSCRPNHGLLVRPSKLSARGINGAKLLGQLSSTPPATHPHPHSGSPSSSGSGRRSRGSGDSGPEGLKT